MENDLFYAMVWKMTCLCYGMENDGMENARMENDRMENDRMENDVVPF